MKAQANIMVSAFGCDLSRVVNWHVRGAFCEGSCDFGGSTNPEMLHVLSHDYLGDFVKVKRAMFEQVAYFAQQLKQTPDRGGTTMLDNTLIVLTSEIAAGHTHSRMPFVTIGGKNMGVKTGRAMKLPVLFKGNTNVARDGTPHSMLFVSILNMMGVPDTWFGIKEYCQGPLPGFTTT